MSGVKKIAVIGGDGTGPEVAAEGVKVLKAVAKLENIKFELTDFDWGGDRYLKTGEALPADGLDQLRKFDAILLGAVGHPDVAPGILERKLLLDLRFGLDQYINLRPVKLFPGVESPLRDKGPEDIDFIVVRENTEDLYCGVGASCTKARPTKSPRKPPSTPAAAASAASATPSSSRASATTPRQEAHARRQDQRHLRPRPLVAHVPEVAEEYPDITKDYNHVDACCMWIVKNPSTTT